MEQTQATINKIMTKILSLPILIFGLFTSFVMAQSPGVLWQAICGGTLWDSGTDIVIVDNNIYISGYTRSFGNTGVNSVIGKFTLDGDLLWLNSYGVAGDDIVLSILHDPDTASLWAAGWAIVNYKQVMSIIQVSLEGKLIKRILLNEGIAEKIIRVDDGFVIAGWYAENIHTVNIKIVKINNQGDILWTTTNNLSDNDRTYDLCKTDNGFLVVGHTESESDQLSIPMVWVIDQDGIIIDRIIFPYQEGWQTEIYSIEKIEDGYIFCMATWNDTGIQAIVIKTDSDLNELWVTELDDLIYGYDIKVLPDNSILVSSSDRTLQYGDATIVQLNSNGAEINRYSTGGIWLDTIHNIDILPDGRCAFVGATYSWNKVTDPDIYIGMIQFNIEFPESPEPIAQVPEKHSGGGGGGCFIDTIKNMEVSVNLI
ncbi:MAG: hypothetical protein MIO92_11415 [Methanosarcinaceae archaeon]|nr:hypothetical protein [Methanosarcinaceae archaeon]